MKKIPYIKKVHTWITAHKIASVAIVIVVLLLAYYVYSKTSASKTAAQYVLSPARIGTITQTVTGSGQVSAENQIDVTSEVSGKVQTINVTVGQHVNTGDVLATLDARDALISLESARIAYAKLVQPAKAGDIANSQNSVAKSYTDGFNAATSLYLNLQNIMPGTKDIFYASDGFLSDQRATYLISTARSYRETAVKSYDRAFAQYEIALREYKELNRASATTSINLFISHSYDLAKLASAMLQNVQSTLTYVASAQPDYYPASLTSTVSTATTWLNQINSDMASIMSSQNTIASSENSLKILAAGAEDLDIQSQRLSLQQAEETYAHYFIRAPFNGTVGRIPVSQYNQASANTIIATIIGDRKIANISLNEVDAAKVKVGQSVRITFDAIDGLNATGTVDRVDLVGTVTQGVVSYTVRIAIDTQDERIKPGMSMNVSIVTKEKHNVLVVPSTAVKSVGNKKYVETLAVTATSTQRMRPITTTSASAPTQIPVTIGDADDANTEITGGIESGTMVVTRTIPSGSTAAAAPNIFSSIGGNRAGAGGATRAVTRPAN